VLCRSPKRLKLYHTYVLRSPDRCLVLEHARSRGADASRFIHLQDLSLCRTPKEKVKKCTQLVKLIVDEVTGLITKIPYGARALKTHKKLPRRPVAPARDDEVHKSVSMSRDVRYDVGERCVMDIYVPANARDAPVALFIHGGVWAAGEKWQFSPLAEHLAHEGIVACVATYSLYPTADAVQMWDEVSRCISFTMDNIGDYGGDAQRISLVGHSAGAQLCARALLQRSGVKNVQSRTNTRKWHDDVRMPSKFVGLAGVYDVGYHYSYEDSRGVAIVSTMGRAMNGPENFDVCSPARLMPKRTSTIVSSPPGPIDLEGDKIAQMAGFSRRAKGDAATSTETFHFPPTILMAGCADVTVPWYESADFHWKLQDAAVPSRLLLYLKEGHTEFVLDWDKKRPRDSLPPYSRDFLRILKH